MLFAKTKQKAAIVLLDSGFSFFPEKKQLDIVAGCGKLGSKHMVLVNGVNMISQRLHNRLWKIAIKIHAACIEDDDAKPYTHISFILDGTDIVSVGFNQVRTHPVCARYGYRHSMHSEVHAAVRLPAMQNLKKMTVVNMRLRNDEWGVPRLRLACPCSRCMNFLSDHGVKKVIYSTDDGWGVWNPSMGQVNPKYGPVD